MPQIAVSILIAIASLIALIALLRGIKAARMAGDWDGSSNYFLWVPAIYYAPMAVGQFTGAVTLQFDVFFNHVTVMAPWLLSFQRVTVALLTALGLIAFFRYGVQRRNIINPVVFALIGVVLIAGISNAVNNNVATFLDTRQIALVALLLGASVLPRGRGAQLGAGTFAIGLCLASSAMTFYDANLAYRDCRVDKCGVLGTLLLGATTGENILGLTLMTALPFVWLGFRGKVRVVLTMYLAFMIVATGSRTALYGAGVALAIIVFTRFSMDRPSRWRIGGAAFIFFSALAATALFPLQEVENGDFSLRGILWNAAKQNIAEHPWLGLGQDAWLSLYTNQILAGTPSAGPHNFFLLVLHEGGIVALVLTAIALIGMLRAGGKNYAVGAIIVLAPVMSSGILEQPWEMSNLAWSTCGMIAAMNALPARPKFGEPDIPFAEDPGKKPKVMPVNYPSPAYAKAGWAKGLQGTDDGIKTSFLPAPRLGRWGNLGIRRSASLPNF